MPTADRVLFLGQYLLLELLAVAAFLYAVLPFERIMDRLRIREDRRTQGLIVFNVLVACGMVLGRYQHINSWLLFTRPLRVLAAAAHVFASADLLGLTLLFGVIRNCVYFLFRRRVLRMAGVA